MTKVGLIKFLILLFLSTTGWAQKVKYKDIFALLNAKQYEEAEPFLKRYLKETDDNPNAYLFMGLIFQEKALKNDILKQTALSVRNMDSSLVCLNKAGQMVDEKEIKRNKEYYVMYNRRDLRTGEFNVTLSDVQFDIQKRTESLKERIDRVKMVKFYFSLADSLYDKTQQAFLKLRTAGADGNLFYLTANETTLASLKAITVRYDSMIKYFEHYQASMQNMGKTGYNQRLNVQTIQDFSKDGSGEADFFSEEIKVWDYKKWASESEQVITKEIIPMRKHLVTYDIELNKLREKLSGDSVSVQSDLTKLIDQLLYAQLRRFDENPLPLQVFSMKIADLEYRSKVIEHKAIKDSANMHTRIRMAREEKRLITRLDSICNTLTAADMEAASVKYEEFITNTYQNTVVLTTYIKGLRDFAIRESRDLDKRIAQQEESLKWIVVDAARVPLSNQPDAPDYHVLLTEEEQFTMGVQAPTGAAAQGYFYTITPNRVPDVRILFPLEPGFGSGYDGLKGLVAHTDQQVYYVVIFTGEKAGDKVTSQVAKIYRTDGLAWTQTIGLSFVPEAATYKAESGVLTLTGADGAKTDLDKNGKMMQ